MHYENANIVGVVHTYVSADSVSTNIVPNKKVNYSTRAWWVADIHEHRHEYDRCVYIQVKLQTKCNN